MGILVNVDLETNRGPSQEVFVRIDNYKVSLTLAKVTFTTTSWVNRKSADDFLRKFIDEPMKNAKNILGLNVVYYGENDQEGTEVTIKNLYEFNLVSKQEVVTPIYIEKEISKEVPRVSFDENGDEITVYKTIKEKVKVQEGEKVEVKEVIDYSILSKLEEKAYLHLKNELANIFPEDKIEIV